MAHTEVLERRLKQYFGEQDFRTVSAHDIKTGALDFVDGRRPDLLVMPGGYSVALAEQLGEEGFAHIRKYLTAGGRGLFICASAYSACNFVWHPAGHQRVAPHQGHGSHATLNLFPHINALGPLPAPQDHSGPYGHGIETLSGYTGLGDARTFYVAGPAFQVPSHPGIKVLASYRRLLNTHAASAAIVQCEVGEGRVILAGPHIEYTTADIVARLQGPRHETLLDTPAQEGPSVQPGADFLRNSSLAFRQTFDPNDPQIEVRAGLFNRILGDLTHMQPRQAQEISRPGLGTVGRRTLRVNWTRVSAPSIPSVQDLSGM